jgi:serine/threonine protein kinase
MADVYLARAQGPGAFEKLVVAKCVLPALAQDPRVVQMFLDEARTAATLRHSNVVQVFDFGEADGRYYLIMEYLNAESASALLGRALASRACLPHDVAVSIARDVCSGLHYAHEKQGADGRPLGIVHRDVSPDNVMVTYHGEVKLVDFGIAKAAHNLAQTKTGALKGKVRYMSPEQARAQAVDRRSDIYSLSVVLWELTVGQRLLRGTNDYESIRAITTSDAPAPSVFRPEYPPGLERVVMRGLARDPDKRWQTARDLRSALEEYAASERLILSTGTLEQHMERVFGSRATLAAEQEPSRLASAHPRAADAAPCAQTGYLTPPTVVPARPPAAQPTTALRRRPDAHQATAPSSAQPTTALCRRPDTESSPPLEQRIPDPPGGVTKGTLPGRAVPGTLPGFLAPAPELTKPGVGAPAALAPGSARATAEGLAPPVVLAPGVVRKTLSGVRAPTVLPPRATATVGSVQQLEAPRSRRPIVVGLIIVGGIGVVAGAVLLAWHATRDGTAAGSRPGGAAQFDRAPRRDSTARGGGAPPKAAALSAKGGTASTPLQGSGDAEWDAAQAMWVLGDLPGCVRNAQKPQAHPLTLSARCTCAALMGDRETVQKSAAEYARRFPDLLIGKWCAAYLRGPEPLGPESVKRVAGAYRPNSPTTFQEPDYLGGRSRWLSRDHRGCLKVTTVAQPSILGLNQRLVCATSAKDLAAMRATCQEIARTFPRDPSLKMCREQVVTIEKYGWGH